MEIGFKLLKELEEMLGPKYPLLEDLRKWMRLHDQVFDHSEFREGVDSEKWMKFHKRIMER